MRGIHFFIILLAVSSICSYIAYSVKIAKERKLKKGEEVSNE